MGEPCPALSTRIYGSTEATPSDAVPQVPFWCEPIPGIEGPAGIVFASVPDASDQPAWLDLWAQEVSLVLIALRRMQEILVHDPMTDTFNRKGLEIEYQRAWSQSRRGGQPLSVAIIDIDRFKEVNDTHGHLAGDRILREFGAVLQKVVRGGDIVARYGGDEFVVILPHANSNAAIAFGERLLTEVRLHLFCERALDQKVTASIGVASALIDNPADTADALLARADKGLLRAKQAGRDRVALEQPAAIRTEPGVAIAEPARAAVKKGRVLVVDDEKPIADMLAKILARQGYEVTVEYSAAAAIAQLSQKGHFDVLLTDLSMPDKGGLELLDELRSLDENLVKIVITGYATLDNAVLSLRRGAYDFIEKPVVQGQLLAVVGRASEYRRLREENLHYQLHLEEMVTEKSAALQDALNKVRGAHEFTLEAMAALLDAREHSTGRHSLRVRNVSVAFGRILGLSESEIEDLARGSLLHDIGKIGIPDHILLKPQSLTEEERRIMHSHTEIGYKILRSNPYLQRAAEIVYCHHEHFDGSGYPRKLSGEQIPLGARLFTLVDSYDAMRSTRIYRAALTRADAANEIQKCRGTQFDPALVDLFLRNREEIENVGNWDHVADAPGPGMLT